VSAPTRQRGGGRTRAPSLLTQAHRTISDFGLLEPGGRVLCACSGGADSTALLHVLALLRGRLGFELEAMGVDHGLRPESAAELALVEQLCAPLGVPWRTERVALTAGSNLQARARVARHTALQRAALAAGANAIAVAHTADDRAETFLMRLLQGAGPRGLAVLGPRTPCPVAVAGPAPGVDIIRPIVGARRADVLLHLERHGLGHSEDPSNSDRRFLRTRLRQELLPLLEELSPRIVSHLCALSMMLEGAAGTPDPLARLGRAQRLAVERARRLGRPGITLRIHKGAELALAFDRLAEGAKRPRRGAR
jgi:tRNA(Ile)-lysidine synthase